jgi:hypothetical protein
MDYKIISINVLVALTAITIITINTQFASASSGTTSDGARDGKAQGHTDAINGDSPNDDCGEGRSNDYCTAYKMAYNIEYHWTNLVQDKD